MSIDLNLLKKLTRRQSAKTGLPPGSMVFVGEQKVEKARIDLMQYGPEKVEEFKDVSVERCHELSDEQSVTWINVIGVHDAELIESVGEAFDLHPLTLEDIMNTSHRLKVEEFPNYTFMVAKILAWDKEALEIKTEHLSLILGDNFLFSFHERSSDLFEDVRNRIRAGKGRIRSMMADYLAYALLDIIVDNYFAVLEGIGDRIEDVDESIQDESGRESIREIHNLKRNILDLRKSVWPLRDEIGTLEKSEHDLLSRESRIYWRDLYDHTVQIIEIIESFRDVLGGMHDTYLSIMSNRMNEIMKVLTIIGTIFIPLSFIAGVYGMNFKFMPELEWKYGYFFAWGTMIITGGALVIYFWRKKWL